MFHVFHGDFFLLDQSINSVCYLILGRVSMFFKNAHHILLNEIYFPWAAFVCLPSLWPGPPLCRQELSLTQLRPQRSATLTAEVERVSRLVQSGKTSITLET